MHPRSLIHCFATAVCGLILLACQSESDGVAEPALLKAAVVGGKEVSVCQYPSTVRVEDCTGTLIHPRVITTAAHCITDGTETIRFGGVSSDPASFTLTGTCKAGARGQSGVGSKNDWAYCMLPDDPRLKQIPITPPLVGCEAERFRKAGSTGWIVGYGTTGPSGQGSGVKRAVEVKINRVSDGTIDVGDREVGACHGDSGGPIYMQLTDGANDYGLRVFGSTSGPGANFCDCSCSTTYVDIANHIKAIEDNEHIDVTPCTDPQGNWAPGPDCNAIQTQAMNGSGTFPNCKVARTTAPIDSCMKGAAPAAGSGGNAAATAGSGAVPTAGVGAIQAGARGAAGAGAVAAAGSGATAAASGVAAAGASGSAARVVPIVGAGTAGASAAVGTSGGGSSAIGTKTQGISAAGISGNSGLAGSFATVPTESEQNAGCSCAIHPVSLQTDTWSGLVTMICGVYLASRPRRRRTGVTCPSMNPVRRHNNAYSRSKVSTKTRSTLREVLMVGLEERIHFSQSLQSCEVDEAGVTARFAGGYEARGAALVGADGIRSVVRQQRAPQARLVDTGLRSIYGRLPIASARALLPGYALADAFTLAADALWISSCSPIGRDGITRSWAGTLARRRLKKELRAMAPKSQWLRD